MVVVPQGAGCATLVADFFLFCYSGGRGVVASLSDDEQAGVVDAFGTCSACLDDIF